MQAVVKRYTRFCESAINLKCFLSIKLPWVLLRSDNRASTTLVLSFQYLFEYIRWFMIYSQNRNVIVFFFFFSVDRE